MVVAREEYGASQALARLESLYDELLDAGASRLTG